MYEAVSLIDDQKLFLYRLQSGTNFRLTQGLFKVEIFLYVIEDDEYYSPASIAGFMSTVKSLAEGEQHLRYLFDAFSVGRFAFIRPGDARRAIMFVAFGAFE